MQEAVCPCHKNLPASVRHSRKLILLKYIQKHCSSSRNHVAQCRRLKIFEQDPNLLFQQRWCLNAPALEGDRVRSDSCQHGAGSRRAAPGRAVSSVDPWLIISKLLPFGLNQ